MSTEMCAKLMLGGVGTEGVCAEAPEAATAHPTDAQSTATKPDVCGGNARPLACRPRGLVLMATGYQRVKRR